MTYFYPDSPAVLTLLDSKLIAPKDAAVRFRAMSLALDPDVTDEEIYDALTEFGYHPEFVAVVAELGTTEFVQKWAHANFDEALWRAAGEGRIKMMNVLRWWGTYDYDVAMNCAAGEGQIEALRILNLWGASSYDWPVYCAAGEGQIEALKLLRNWGDTYWYRAFNAANINRNVAAMNLLKIWTRW